MPAAALAAAGIPWNRSPAELPWPRPGGLSRPFNPPGHRHGHVRDANQQVRGIARHATVGKLEAGNEMKPPAIFSVATSGTRFWHLPGPLRSITSTPITSLGAAHSE
jgi:hypothetical protein